MRKKKPRSQKAKNRAMRHELLRLRLERARLQTTAMRRALGLEDHLKAQDPIYRSLCNELFHEEHLARRDAVERQIVELQMERIKREV